MNDLSSPLLNSIHMVLGVVSELNSELISALSSGKDPVNIGEEIADINWYLANYTTIWGIEVPEQFINTYYSSIQSMEQLLIFTGELADLDKKLLAYGKEVTLEQRSILVLAIWSYLDHFADHLRLDPEKLRATNIEKLKSRYGDKFDADKAINRDLGKEREILETGV